MIVIFAFNAKGQNTTIDSIYNSELQKCNLVEIPILQSFSQTTEITPFQSGTVLSNLLISGHALFESEKSLIRVILVDNEYDEYLIYENNFLLTDSLNFVIDKEYFETGYLSDVVPLKIKIIIDSATLYIDKFSYGVLSQMKSTTISSIKNNLIPNKNQKNISRINFSIEKKNLLWLAGETSFSQLTYKEKKQYFGDTLPNLYGFEYYVGGIFEIPEDNKSKSQTITSKNDNDYVSNFDWRNRHGRNWNTSVKDQFNCSRCWAFTAVASVEALLNLFYNQHIDLDLSEQQIASCSSPQLDFNNCEKGYIVSAALQYIQTNGVVDEICAPYYHEHRSCTTNYNNPSPTAIVKIGGVEYLSGASINDIKKAIIEKGVLAGSLYCWNHAMALVGYGTINLNEHYYNANIIDALHHSPFIVTDPNDSRIGKTYLIFKNSWGLNSNQGNSSGDGYVYALMNVSTDKYSFHIPLAPITNLLQNYNVNCEDLDGDGYYNWGIGPKPENCPICPDEEDCDDSNPMFGPYDERYGCSFLCENYVHSEIPLEISTSQIWDELKFFNQNIVIKPNVILTIKSTIKLGENVSINIEPGGQLIVNGGTLTNACPNKYWQGINVEGNKNKVQNLNNQGYVEMTDATIENARNAVSMWKPEYWNTTGGIIKAQSTIFRNNIRSVEFLTYHNIYNNIDFTNASKFNNCTFVWDENMIAENIDHTSLSHVTMWDVKGVKFQSCNFSNSNQNSNIIYHHGISSIFSGFNVNYNTFDNLEYGVRAEDQRNNMFKISNTEFDNNAIGVFTSSANNFEVSQCNFNLEGKNTPGHIYCADGLTSYYSTGYKIEGNYFKGNSGSLDGVVILSSGDAYNEIRNNSFHNLTAGFTAQGRNRGPSNVSDATGLQYYCNSFNNCIWGVMIGPSSEAIKGIAPYQGSAANPECNTYDNNNIDIYNYANCEHINYYVKLGSEPTCDEDYPNITFIPTIIECGSKCGNNTTKTSNKDTLYFNLTTLNNEYLLLLYNYNNILDGGHKDVLLEKLEDSWSGSDWELRDSYMQESPYLSTDVLIELVKSEKLPLAMCAEILLSNPDATQKDDFREFMNKEDTYLTPLAKLLIEESWNSVTLRTNVESNISAKLGEIEFVSRDLINIILNDTLGLNINEYRNVLSDLRNISSKFELVDSYIGTQEYNLARNLLLELQSDADNQKHYSEEIESYLIYLSIMENADTPNNLKDDDLIYLSNYNTRAGHCAKSILYFKGKMDYHPSRLIIDSTEKYVRKSSGKLSDLMKVNIILSPNPAKDYITISYDLEPRKIEYSIKIYNNKGSIVYSGYLKGNKGIQNIDTRSFEAGTYLYNVENGNERCNNGKFIIVR